MVKCEMPLLSRNGQSICTRQAVWITRAIDGYEKPVCNQHKAGKLAKLFGLGFSFRKIEKEEVK